jgi:hypothetical protein
MIHDRTNITDKLQPVYCDDACLLSAVRNHRTRLRFVTRSLYLYISVTADRHASKLLAELLLTQSVISCESQRSTLYVRSEINAEKSRHMPKFPHSNREQNYNIDVRKKSFVKVTNPARLRIKMLFTMKLKVGYVL